MQMAKTAVSITLQGACEQHLQAAFPQTCREQKMHWCVLVQEFIQELGQKVDEVAIHVQAGARFVLDRCPAAQSSLFFYASLHGL